MSLLCCTPAELRLLTEYSDEPEPATDCLVLLMGWIAFLL